MRTVGFQLDSNVKSNPSRDKWTPASTDCDASGSARRQPGWGQSPPLGSAVRPQVWTQLKPRLELGLGRSEGSCFQFCTLWSQDPSFTAGTFSLPSAVRPVQEQVGRFQKPNRVSNVFESGKCQIAAERFNKEEEEVGRRWRSPCQGPTDCLFLILKLIITSVSGSDSKWIYLLSIKSSHLHPGNHPKVKMWSWIEAEKWKQRRRPLPFEISSFAMNGKSGICVFDDQIWVNIHPL